MSKHNHDINNNNNDETNSSISLKCIIKNNPNNPNHDNNDIDNLNKSTDSTIIMDNSKSNNNSSSNINQSNNQQQQQLNKLRVENTLTSYDGSNDDKMEEEEEEEGKVNVGGDTTAEDESKHKGGPIGRNNSGSISNTTSITSSTTPTPTPTLTTTTHSFNELRKRPPPDQVKFYTGQVLDIINEYLKMEGQSQPISQGQVDLIDDALRQSTIVVSILEMFRDSLEIGGFTRMPITTTTIPPTMNTTTTTSLGSPTTIITQGLKPSSPSSSLLGPTSLPSHPFSPQPGGYLKKQYPPPTSPAIQKQKAVMSSHPTQSIVSPSPTLPTARSISSPVGITSASVSTTSSPSIGSGGLVRTPTPQFISDDTEGSGDAMGGGGEEGVREDTYQEEYDEDESFTTSTTSTTRNNAITSPSISDTTLSISTAGHDDIPSKPTNPIKKKRGRPPIAKPTKCSICEKTTTPEWRKGENGADLCNACGLQFMKRNKKEKESKQKHSLNNVVDTPLSNVQPSQSSKKKAQQLQQSQQQKPKQYQKKSNKQPKNQQQPQQQRQPEYDIDNNTGGNNNNNISNNMNNNNMNNINNNINNRNSDSNNNLAGNTRSVNLISPPPPSDTNMIYPSHNQHHQQQQQQQQRQFNNNYRIQQNIRSPIQDPYYDSNRRFSSPPRPSLYNPSVTIVPSSYDEVPEDFDEAFRQKIQRPSSVPLMMYPNEGIGGGGGGDGTGVGLTPPRSLYSPILPFTSNHTNTLISPRISSPTSSLSSSTSSLTGVVVSPTISNNSHFMSSPPRPTPNRPFSPILHTNFINTNNNNNNNYNINNNNNIKTPPMMRKTQ